MDLSDTEKAMLDGSFGPAHRKAMELLVKYGEALGAPRLVETSNVATTTTATHPLIRKVAAEEGMDAVFSRFNLDSDEAVETPAFAVSTSQLIHGVYGECSRELGTPADLMLIHEESVRFFGARGTQMMSTCTPYQVGNVPALGEHVAWMESSAVAYCNSVLGGRTNTEGRESTGAAAVTGRIPYFGLHDPAHRRATHHVRVEIPVESMEDWGLLGYWVGRAVEDAIPVIDGPGIGGTAGRPTLPRLKHLGAAASSSGGVEMFHLPGVTPEAPSVEAALGGRVPVERLVYGAAERAEAYARLNVTARRPDVDLVMLGCPHDTLDQVWRTAVLLEGRRVHEGTALWIHTPRAIAEVADRSGYTATIEAAGGRLLSDTCPAISRILPPGTEVVATDSAKQAHYLPQITGVETWFGSLEACIDAAVTGRWAGADA
jgi:predicted aconitase